MNPAFQEHVLNAPDVCNNCFSLVREDRDEYVPDRFFNKARLGELDTVSRPSDGRGFVKTARYARVDNQTEECYPPTEYPTNSKRIYCECGASGSFDRIWSDQDIDKERFKEFVRHLHAALAHKRIAHDAQTFARHAVHCYRRLPPGHVGPMAEDAPETINDILASAMAAAQVRATTQQRSPAD